MKEPISYLDFDLRIEREADGYRAEVVNSPAGQGSCSFKLPFSKLEMENFLLRVGRPRHSTRRMDSPEIAAAKTFGGRLYDSLMSGEVNARWCSSLTEAESQGHGLRLRLRIADAPELNGMPWEYLYNSSLNRFLSLSERTPLVRYLEMPERIRPLAVEAPIRVLVAISSPSNYPPLDVEREWTQLQAALEPLTRSGLVVMDRLTNVRLSVLRDKLRDGEYHILHFIGHGGFDTGSDEGALVFCDPEGKGRIIGAQRFGTVLHDHQSLRLVILNACEGSRSSEKDPFAGTAQTLVQQGIPAVIAMQFEITDPAAITFAKEFYSVVARGHPVDAALAQARLAIFADENDIEWGTPVIYMRAQDGRIFTVRHDPSKPVQAPLPAAPEPAAPPQQAAAAPPIQAPAQARPEQAAATQPIQIPAQQPAQPAVQPTAERAATPIARVLSQLLGTQPFFSQIPPPPQQLAPTAPAGQAKVAWRNRRSGQIGLSMLGVLIVFAGIVDTHISDDYPLFLIGLVAISVLVVGIRWTWLLYTWGSINCLMAAVMLVGMADSGGSEQQVFTATFVALVVELAAIFLTIRSKRAIGRL